MDLDAHPATPLTQQRRNLVLALVAVQIVLGLQLWSWGSVEGFAMATHSGGCKDDVGNLQLFCDAVRYYLPAGEAIARGQERVAGFLYPPPFAFLMSAITSLFGQASLLVWVAALALTTIGLFVLPAAALFSRSRTVSVAHAVCFAGAMPLIANFYWGQVSALVTLCVLAAFVLYARGHTIGCALLLGLAIALKIYPAIFVLPLLLKRDFRSAAVTALVAFILMWMLPVAVFGISGTSTYYRETFAEMDAVIAVTSVASYGPNVVSRLLSGEVRFDSQLFGFLQQGAILVVLANFVLLHKLIRARAQEESFWAAALVLASLPFLVRTMWIHAYSYLPFVQMFALYGALPSREAGAIRRAALVTGVAVSCLFSSYWLLRFIGNYGDYDRGAFVFWANAIVLIVLHVVGWTTVAKARDGEGRPGVPVPQNAP